MLIYRAEFIKKWRWWHCLKKKKPKENQKRKKKGKNIIDSGNVLGWTPTVSKGTDVEILHKLLYLCISFNGVLCCTVSLSIPNVICIMTKTWYKKIHITMRTTSQWCPDPISKLILYLFYILIKILFLQKSGMWFVFSISFHFIQL